MNEIPQWWRKPRRVSVVVDNESWVTPYCKDLVGQLNDNGDEAIFCGPDAKVPEGDVAFYFGCVKVTPAETLARNRRNLVAHASDLPHGKGFSPLSWQIIEGQNRIPLCLIEAVDAVDSGPVIYREIIEYQGHELLADLQARLGQAQVDLAIRFLKETMPPEGEIQVGEGSVYPRRNPQDSKLDVTLPLAEQFNLLRTVDNDRYPAFFDLHGHRYKLTIDEMDGEEN